MTSALYFSALGLIALIHAWRVISLRRKNKVSLGDGGIRELEVAIRVFGNFMEWVPLGLVLLAALEFVQAPGWYVHVAGVLLLFGRVLHAQGLLMHERALGRGRMFGMVFTLLSVLSASIGITLYSYFGF